MSKLNILPLDVLPSPLELFARSGLLPMIASIKEDLDIFPGLLLLLVEVGISGPRSRNPFPLTDKDKELLFLVAYQRKCLQIMNYLQPEYSMYR